MDEWRIGSRGLVCSFIDDDGGVSAASETLSDDLRPAFRQDSNLGIVEADPALLSELSVVYCLEHIGVVVVLAEDNEAADGVETQSIFGFDFIVQLR